MRGAVVCALVQPGRPNNSEDQLKSIGAAVAEADPAEVDSLAAACDGATCVISALNGLRDVIVERQGKLLDAAIRAGVPKFFPSDYSLDFTKTEPGSNRNLDLRREFSTLANARAAASSIRLTSILNGEFMDMLGAEMPIIRPRLRRVLCWRSEDQRLDFTTKNNVAEFTAAAAMDSTTPRFVRIAGDSVSARDIAAIMSELTGKRFRTLRLGGLGTIGLMIRTAKLVTSQSESVFPAWQGMQYMRDQFGGR